MLFIFRTKVLASGALSIAILLWGAPSGFTENVPADSSIMLQRALMKSIDLPTPPLAPAHIAEPAVLVPEAEQAQSSIEVEAPRRISLDQLRRANVLYPDQNPIERFTELSTDCPPLFGTDD